MIMIPRRAFRLVGLVLLALGGLALVAENLR
jgi:hypothetical protein